MDTGRNIRFWVLVAAALQVPPCGFIFARGMEDRLVEFSTPGPDSYADGTAVCDGECYALVWSPKGASFSGFNADGTAVSASDRVVLAGALAVGGRCRRSIFQIPAVEYAALADGEWAVCLVDTRRADGTPAGVAGNAPLRVNRWGVVEGGVSVSPAGISSMRLLASANAATAKAASGGACAGILSEVPEEAKSPRITSFEVVDGEVRMRVEGTVPYLTYTLVSGDEPGALAADPGAGIADGDAEAEIELAAEVAGASRFFRVARAE